MILVTLGTQDKSFKRLLETIQKQIDKGNIKEKVIVQAGFTKFKSDDMEIFDLIPTEEFKDLVYRSSLIITHGGVGSIMDALKHNKVVIAAPRLKKYGEHDNDHQLEIINNFARLGYILPLKDFNMLDKLLVKAKGFKPKKLESNTHNIVAMIEDYIDNI